MKKIILIAFSLDRKLGSETGMAGQWLDMISNQFYVEVITDVIHKSNLLNAPPPNCKFHFIENTLIWRKIGRKINLPNIGPKVFFYKVEKLLSTLDLRGVIAIHCITPAGIHSHNKLYKFKVPLIIGPLGGALPTPPNFEKAFRKQRVKTYLRDLSYKWYLKSNKKLKNYLMNANKVVLGISLKENMLPVDISNKVVHIPDALVDTEYFSPPTSRSNSTVRILFAGRLTGSKGPLLMLDALKEHINNGGNNFVVEIAGGGELYDEISKMIKRENLQDYVVLLGILSKKQLLIKYQTSDIFCLPTLREPGGISILEAMSCGLPIITSNYGGPSVLVTDECGIKINLTNYQEYVKELTKAIDQLVNKPKLRLKMGLEARKRAEENYSPQAIRETVFSLYSQ